MFLEKPPLPLGRRRLRFHGHDRDTDVLAACLEAIVTKVAAHVEDHASSRHMGTDELPAWQTVALTTIHSIWV